MPSAVSTIYSFLDRLKSKDSASRMARSSNGSFVFLPPKDVDIRREREREPDGLFYNGKSSYFTMRRPGVSRRNKLIEPLVHTCLCSPTTIMDRLRQMPYVFPRPPLDRHRQNQNEREREKRSQDARLATPHPSHVKKRENREKKRPPHSLSRSRPAVTDTKPPATTKAQQQRRIRRQEQPSPSSQAPSTAAAAGPAATHYSALATHRPGIIASFDIIP